MAKTPEKAVAEKVEKAEFRLTRAYWDGRRDHAVGDVLTFEVGKQPKSAVRVKPEPEPQLELDLDE